MPKNPLNIGFVCQPGRLEAQALLLAASLDQQVGNRTRLIAAIAQDPTGMAKLSSSTVKFLEGLGVEMRPIVNPISPDYPIGNKLGCMKLLEDRNQMSLFLDTDMIILEDFLSIFEEPFEFMAKPADLTTSGLMDQQWIQTIENQGVKAPVARFMTTHDMQIGIPYFNAGFIGLSEDSKISDSWIEHANQLARLAGRHDYHLDQISLTIAVCVRGLQIRPITEDFNFPAHLRPLPPSGPVRVVHYHHPDRVAGNIRIRREILELCQRYEGLRELLGADAEWGWTSHLSSTRIASGTNERKCRENPDFIVTGIPRSGTSLFSAAMASLPNTVVINEPAEIFKALQIPGGYGLSIHYQNLRASILAGQEVRNKVDEAGRLVEDTATWDVRRKIRYSVKSDDFFLGTKNTLAYLSRLEQISETMPGSVVFCCIRNPLSTIASWIRSFDHLRQATPGQSKIGTLTDPFLADSERDLLRQIENQTDYAVKRALWWNFLARRILRNLDRLILLRYEDYISQSDSYLRQAASAIGNDDEAATAICAKKKDLRVIDRRGELSVSEIQCIRGICGSLAARFGYEI